MITGLRATVALIAATWLIQASLACADDTTKPTPPEEALRQADALSTAFAYAAEVVSPSVVSIQAVKRVKAARYFGDSPMPGNQGFPFDDEFLRRFFGGPVPHEDFVQQGVASGVIVSDEGHILTNNHVVADADELTVILNAGQQYSGKIVATDPMTDLAVVQVQRGGLQPARFGDSDKLKVGQWVIAVGDPFGLDDTITAGIVSAKGRSNVRIAAYEDFIQTDAAINPGNSGGPSVNLRGEVVGINTAIATGTGGNQGVGFAIPINMAKSIMDTLITKGRVVRGFLGAIIQPLDEGLAKSFGYPESSGVLIGDVTPGGPGERGGLKQGDIVVRFAGKKANDVNRLRNWVASSEPGLRV